MNFGEFQKTLGTYTFFTSDITGDAEQVARLLSDEQRAELMSKLQDIHDACSELEKQRTEQFALAIKELDGLRRKYLPAIHKEIEQTERDSAIEEISGKLDDQ